jgi:hypothetical protein
MSIAKIHGSEYPIRKIFCNDFVFRIPLYQRPYAWTIEQAGELIDDLLGFIGSDNGSIDDLSPYFLGSIVLIKQEHLPEAEIVDGQQRLTTITILLSALRRFLTGGLADSITKYLYEKGDELEGTPNRYRLTLRERDAAFFRRYVQDDGKIATLRSLEPRQLSDSQRNIRANSIHFLDRLESLHPDQRIRLAQFIAKQCLLVVVTTPDLDSAYRIFSILNDRGLDLSHSDILKSEIIGKVPSNLQEEFNELWEDAEEELGREAFSDLFAHVRMIYRKAKYKESILKEFREYVIKKESDPRRLIQEVLVPNANAFEKIRNASYESTVSAEQVNDILRWLNRIENTDWVPPALAFFVKHASQPRKLVDFLSDLERLAASMMLRCVDINKRIDRYGQILEWIEKGEDLKDAKSPLQLTDVERKEFVDELDGEIYRFSPDKRLYVLLRLDAALSDGSASYDYGVISIEHVLPQNPPSDSEWCKWFPDPQVREKQVHRLGNLLLLNFKKNSAANNKPFGVKKQAYFTKGGVSPFALTTQAISETQWTEEVIERRQAMLTAKLKELWRL